MRLVGIDDIFPWLSEKFPAERAHAMNPDWRANLGRREKASLPMRTNRQFSADVALPMRGVGQID